MCVVFSLHSRLSLSPYVLLWNRHGKKMSLTPPFSFVRLRHFSSCTDARPSDLTHIPPNAERKRNIFEICSCQVRCLWIIAVLRIIFIAQQSVKLEIILWWFAWFNGWDWNVIGSITTFRFATQRTFRWWSKPFNVFGYGKIFTSLKNPSRSIDCDADLHENRRNIVEKPISLLPEWIDQRFGEANNFYDNWRFNLFIILDRMFWLWLESNNLTTKGFFLPNFTVCIFAAVSPEFYLCARGKKKANL